MFRKLWRVGLLMALVLSASLAGLFAGSVAAADNGVVISDGASGPFNRPNVGKSADSGTICVVWSKFKPVGDTVPNRTYIRLYNVRSGTWQPALGAAPYDVTKGSNIDTQGGSPRCTIDANGRTHVVWAEGANKYIRYTSLPAGADPSQAANWSNPATISAESDSQSPDIATLIADANGSIWLAYVANIGGNYDILVRNWTNGVWSGAQTAADAGSATAHYPHIAVDDAGYVHVLFWQGSGGGIRYTYRDKDTGAFSASVQLPGAGGGIQTGGIAVDRASGDVHAVYVTNIAAGDDGRVVRYVKKTGPIGTSFTGPTDLTGQGNYNNSSVGISAAGRVIVVANKRSASPEQVVFAISENAGADWGDETTLTDSAVRAYDPGLAVIDNGVGYVAYWNKNGDKIQFASVNGSTPPPPPPPCPEGFSCWGSQGGILSDSPAAAGFGGRLYAFAKGSDNALYVKSSTDGVAWSAWEDRGGILTAPPAAASFGGRLYVFAKGSDNALYVQSTDGVAWSAWDRLGGILTAAPAAASYTPAGGAETLYLAVRGSDGAVYERHRAAGESDYTPWRSLGGQVVGPPAAAGVGTRLYILARWVDNALYVAHTTP